MANRGFNCEVCKIDAGSESNLMSHLNGVKHRKRLKLLGIENETIPTIAPVISQNQNIQKRNAPDTSQEKNVINKIKEQNSIKVPDLNCERIKEIVTSKLSFEQMMEHLMTELQLPVHIMNEKYNRLCRDLQVALSRSFRNCEIYPFGSTITGLGFKNSDLDIYVDIKRHSLPPDLRDKDASELTKISKKILYKTRIFSKIIAIPYAKTPIVKCVHVPTGIQCDFNFKSMLGVCNSRLIKFLLSSNKSFLGTMIVIKCWAKFHGISGTGKFTNYTLSMMFIFYLQVNHYLPSVFSLQLQNEHAFMQEGWNGGFCNDVNLLPKVDTPMETLIPQLLLGFFKYYSTFDYAFNVISPLVGKTILKSSFNDIQNLPSELVFYKQVVTKNIDNKLKISASICLQDPFVLIHNVTANIMPKLSQEFQGLCENSWKTVEMVKDPSNIFYRLLFTIHKQKAGNFKMPSIEMCTFKIPFNASVFVITSDSISDQSNEWFNKLHQLLISVLSKVFLFNITARKENSPKKIMKSERQTDVHNNDIFETMTFHCIGYVNTWDDRKNKSKLYDASNDNKKIHSTILDREIAISDTFFKVDEKSKKTPIVDFDLSIIAKLNPTEAKFTLLNINSKKDVFKSMANNLGILIPNYFDTYLKEIFSNKQVKIETKNTKLEIEIKESPPTKSTNDPNNSEVENVNSKIETNNDTSKINKFLASIEKIHKSL